jgi:hypothetical protein
LAEIADDNWIEREGRNERQPLIHQEVLSIRDSYRTGVCREEGERCIGRRRSAIRRGEGRRMWPNCAGFRCALQNADQIPEAGDVGALLYEEIRIKVLPQEQATKAGIAFAFDEIKSEVQPTDVFVLFVAGHGRTVESTGTYYFLPRDLTFEGGHSVEDGIGQDTWQAWLKQIAADKSILVFDTCESAAAIGLSIRGVSERETAIDRLSLATGQTIITAARQAAYEGYKGHGVLTYAILDALTEKASEKSHEVDLYQLVEQVDRVVPEISHSLFGVYQRPHNKVEGNFPLGVTTAAVAAPDSEPDIPAQPTHVLIRNERVRQRAAAGAPGERKLVPGSQVRVVRRRTRSNHFWRKMAWSRGNSAVPAESDMRYRFSGVPSSYGILSVR